MKLQCRNSDRISVLPQEIIEKILSLIPIEDALRTSILSKNWRYCWTGIPTLAFDVVQLSPPDDEEFIKCKRVIDIFHVLLLHRAPILEFSLSVEGLEMFSEIDQIILHLSKSNSIKKFNFGLYQTNFHCLHSSFFSLKTLEHIELTLCAIELPLMFNGFSKLKSLCLIGVYITTKTILVFLTNCPLLEKFIWRRDCHIDDFELTECELDELFKCLPLVQVLEISNLYIKYLAAGGMPHKLPISLVHLRILVLNVCSLALASVVCVISSSPNLEKFKVELCGIHRWCSQKTCKNLLDHQEYIGLNLDHLKDMEIIRFSNHAFEMKFVRLIMAKSPVLKKAQIELCTSVSVDEENVILQDLIHLPLPRASPAVEVIIKRPSKLMWENK